MKKLSAEQIEVLSHTYEGADAQYGGHHLIQVQSNGQDKWALSHAQQRIWLIQNLYPDLGVYNINVAFEIGGRLAPAILQQHLQTLVTRHQALNLVITQGDDALPVQRVAQYPVELQCETSTRGEVNARIAEIESQAFNMEKGPLYRFVLFQLDDGHDLLLLVFHHIVSDGWSVDIFIRELKALYAGQALPEQGAQFSDYVNWHNRYVEHHMQAEDAYWREMFATPYAGFRLPAQRDDASQMQGGFVHLQLNETLSRAVYGFARRHNLSLFSVGLASFYCLLHKLTGCNDLVVATPTTGREQHAIADTFGLFVNTLLLRQEVPAQHDFIHFAKQVHQVVAQGLSYQQMPLDNLIDMAGLRKENGHIPALDCMFSLNTLQQDDSRLGDFTMHDYPSNSSTSRFMLVQEWTCWEEQITLTFQYDTAKLKEDTLKAFVLEQTALLSVLMTEPELAIENSIFHANDYGYGQVLPDVGAQYRQWQTFFQDVAVTPKAPINNALPITTEAQTQLHSVALSDALLSCIHDQAKTLNIGADELLYASALWYLPQHYQLPVCVFTQHQQHSSAVCLSYSEANSQSKGASLSLELSKVLAQLSAVEQGKSAPVDWLCQQLSQLPYEDENGTSCVMMQLLGANDAALHDAKSPTLAMPKLILNTEQACLQLVCDQASLSQAEEALTALVTGWQTAVTQALASAEINASQVTQALLPKAPAWHQMQVNQQPYETVLCPYSDAKSSDLPYWLWQCQGATFGLLDAEAYQASTYVNQSTHIDAAQWHALLQTAEQFDVKPLQLVQSAFAWVISQYFQTSDVLFAQLNEEYCLPIRAHLKGPLGCLSSLSVASQLHISQLQMIASVQTHAQQHLAIEHNDFANIKRQLQAERQQGRLFDFALRFLENGKQVELDEIAEVTLTLNANDAQNNGVTVQIRLPKTDTRHGFWNAFFASFCHVISHSSEVLETAQSNANQTHVNTLSDEQLAFILHVSQGTELALPSVSVYQQFMQQVDAKPDASAIDFAAGSWSYRTLYQHAENVAANLQNKGVTTGDSIGLSIERKPEVIAVILACLKCGICYVPMDKKYPQERLNFIAEDSGLTWVVIDSPEQQALFDENASNEASVNTVFVSELIAESTSLTVANSGEDAHQASLMYTSGSTGIPKGVQVSQGNIKALCEWANDSFTPEEGAAVLASTSLNFDLSIFEILYPLTQGNKVVLVENIIELTQRPVEMTLINTVPSAAEALIKGNQIQPSLKVINLAGEPLPPAILRDLLASEMADRVCNLYGPTEATVYSTWRSFEQPEDPVSIGRPIANAYAYVLDEQHQLVPFGAEGELYIGGLGVTMGYHQRPELTDERFLANPFGAGKIYKTGDLVKWDDNQELLFIGRNDEQVKVRGLRVELGEISSRLNELPWIAECVVAVEPKIQRLLAFVIVSDDSINKAQVESKTQAALKQQLPQFMVPEQVVVLDTFPLTVNGKTDKKTLIEIAIKEKEKGAKLPSTEAEHFLAEIWQASTGLTDVDIEADFYQLGGSSLSALKVLADIHAYLGVKVELDKFIRASSITSMIALLAERLGGEDALEERIFNFKLVTSISESELMLLAEQE
ncbi:non-ribosomal peptide synthetase [Alteromonas sp. a30]|uniref:non-ribosomal peptide synthetase n=1 Tax=Alteromonas sp. a30 TaxID=2730917 RepID=UPI00228097EB|nr:non-ribosomal peptide synthetase [Alteromonas sp. a30]MCY7294922.1 amino acid adenylation domain-containing protein [Alteromonas sp. a30]